MAPEAGQVSAPTPLPGKGGLGEQHHPAALGDAARKTCRPDQLLQHGLDGLGDGAGGLWSLRRPRRLWRRPHEGDEQDSEQHCILQRLSRLDARVGRAGEGSQGAFPFGAPGP